LAQFKGTKIISRISNCHFWYL